MTPMEPPPPPGMAPVPGTVPERRGKLALFLEEVFTVICRLRVDKPADLNLLEPALGEQADKCDFLIGLHIL